MNPGAAQRYLGIFAVALGVCFGYSAKAHSQNQADQQLIHQAGEWDILKDSVKKRCVLKRQFKNGTLLSLHMLGSSPVLSIEEPRFYYAQTKPSADHVSNLGFVTQNGKKAAFGLIIEDKKGIRTTLIAQDPQKFFQLFSTAQALQFGEGWWVDSYYPLDGSYQALEAWRTCNSSHFGG